MKKLSASAWIGIFSLIALGNGSSVRADETSDTFAPVEAVLTEDAVISEAETQANDAPTTPEQSMSPKEQKKALHEARHLAKEEAKIAKQQAKLEERQAKQQAKLEEREAKQQAKLEEREAKQQAKLEQRQAKREAKLRNENFGAFVSTQAKLMKREREIANHSLKLSNAQRRGQDDVQTSGMNSGKGRRDDTVAQAKPSKSGSKGKNHN